mgnify:FL=1
MKTYVIITRDEVGGVDYSKVQETSAHTLRYNRIGTKTFLKYDGDKPSFLYGKIEYTNDEFLAILNDVNGEWYVEDTSSL